MYILWDLRNPHPFLLHDLGSEGSVLTRATPQHWTAVPLAGISDNKSWQWGKLCTSHMGKDSGIKPEIRITYPGPQQISYSYSFHDIFIEWKLEMNPHRASL